MKIPIENIIIDEELYPRNGPNWLTIYQYAEAMASGSTFPPVVVGRKHKTLVLLDGRHRLLAAQRLDRKHVAAILSRVRPERFFEEAVRLNAANGRQLSVQERIEAIIKLRALGYEDAKITKIMWIPLTSLRRMVADRAERIQGVGASGRLMVRKAVVPAGRLVRQEDQRSFAAQSQVHLFQQVIALFEHDFIEWNDKEIQGLIARLRGYLVSKKKKQRAA